MGTINIISNYSDYNYLLEAGREEDWEMVIADLEREKELPERKYKLYAELKNFEPEYPKNTKVFADKFLAFLKQMSTINTAINEWHIWDGDMGLGDNINDDLDTNFYQMLENMQSAEAFQNNPTVDWGAYTKSDAQGLEGTGVSYSTSSISSTYLEKQQIPPGKYEYKTTVFVDFSYIGHKESIGVLFYNRICMLLEIIVNTFGGKLLYANVQSNGYSMLFNVFPGIHKAVGWITFVPVELKKEDFPEVEILEHFAGGTILAVRKNPFGNLGVNNENAAAIRDAQEVQIKLVDMGVLP